MVSLTLTSQIVDGALVMDAVAQLPENTVFKYRLRTAIIPIKGSGSKLDSWVSTISMTCPNSPTGTSI
jgi:hypothetical protein